MAIYKPPKPRWRTALAGGLAGLVLGAALGGWIAGRGGPDTASTLRDVGRSLSGAAGVLEVLEIEYRESVRDGQVVREPEYRGARDALARSRGRFGEVRYALSAVAPEGVKDVDRGFDELADLIGGRASPDEVAARARALGARLRAMLGG